MRRPVLHALLLVFAIQSAPSSGWTAPIDIPVDTWVRRPLPPGGQGPCPGACKHVRLAFNPDDGRIYFNGGDYGGGGYTQSGRNDTWSYSIADSTWRLEYPYCGPVGEVQPMHPDETGWAYDTRRKKFWMVPGYMGGDTGECAGMATMYRFEIMTFDPATKKWTFENRREIQGFDTGADGFAQYDPVTDTIIQFTYCGVGIYDIATDTWTLKDFPSLNCFIPKEYTAMDLVDRVIYVIEGYQRRLYRYDMDARTMTVLGPTPPGAGATHSTPVWDSVNRVILWFDYSPDYYPAGGRLHVYHPDTNTWEVNRPIYQPQGSTVFGLNQVFDPQQNALLVMGSTSDPTPYFYLYRYGNGGGGAPADSVAPSAPTNLRPR